MMKWLGQSWNQLCEMPFEHFTMAISLYNQEQEELQKLQDN